MSKKRILFVLRSDAELKKGGDVSLMLSFKRELSDSFTTDVHYGVPSVEKLRCYDLAFCCNLDRPVEPYFTMKRCIESDVRFLIYTLHHPYVGMVEYLKSGVQGGKGVVAMLASNSPQRYETILWCVRFLYTFIFKFKLLPLFSVKRAQESILKYADKVVVAAEAEARVIKQDVGALEKYSVCPHILDSNGFSWKPTQRLIVVPGRIESRKNQLLVLRLAESFPDLTFKFVGGFNPSEPQYKSRFMESISKYSNCELISELDKNDFYSLICSAQVVVTASWFEVTSLIELFCINRGITLVCSKNSYNESNERIFKFDPVSLAEVAHVFEKAMSVNINDVKPREKESDMGVIIDIVKGML